MARDPSGMPFRYLSVSRPCASGTKEMQPIPAVSSVSSRPSSSVQRLIIEYEGWWMSAGTPISFSRRAASAVCSLLYEDTPTYSALPCCTADASAPIVSSSGVSGSKRWE